MVKERAMKRVSIKKGIRDILTYKDDYICHYDKTIQKVDRKTGTVKGIIKRRSGYYISILCTERGYLAALSLYGDCVDIFNISTMRLVHSFKRKGKNKLTREESVFCYHPAENSIYCCLSNEDSRKESDIWIYYISKISLDDMTEELLISISNCYAYAAIYHPWKEDVLLLYKVFHDDDSGTGIHKGMWMKHPEEEIVLKDSKEDEIDIERVWFTEDGSRITYTHGPWYKALQFPGQKDWIRDITDAAISDDHKWFAYIKEERIYLYSLEENRVKQEIEIERVYKGYFFEPRFYKIRFLGNDHLYCHYYNYVLFLCLYEIDR